MVVTHYTGPGLEHMKLPIDVVPNSRPLRFKWRQTVHNLSGTSVVELEGHLPPTVEQAVKELIEQFKEKCGEVQELTKLTREQAKELDGLRKAPTSDEQVTFSQKPTPPPVKKGK